MAEQAVLEARMALDIAIVETCLPRLYYLLDAAISGQLCKEDMLEAQKLLPAWCDNSIINGRRCG